MRLLRALRAVLHYKASIWLMKASERHLYRAEAIHADIRLRRMVAPRKHAIVAHFPGPASRVLLASIVGLAICVVWVWFSARAGR